MPNKPGTQHRSVRVGDERWEAAAANAALVGTDRAKWINDCLAWLNHEPGAKRPIRPAQPAKPPQPE